MSSPALPRARTTASGATPGRGPESSRTITRHPPVPSAAAGRYRYDRHAGSWWWSPEMHEVLGLDAAGTTPCTEALLRAQHPDDGGRVLAALTACGTGRPFVLETRIVHPTRPQRSVVLVGEPARDDAGDVRAVEGLCVDITGCRPPAPAPDGVARLHAEIEQLRTAMASRAVIEQAKGVLMVLTGCAEQVAFDLLAHISSHTHRKVREVAQVLTGSAAGQGGLPDDVRAILRDACPPA
ncbi:ANTAR domain-containing protein [Blastococcus sp. VKM Ac-2987]|uniref:ANTAR domain-containing protein n=1 Tax=Blastococcus sp. VKM Ac-2987 TaxID=3004141 RepID=UPI0022AB9CC0|nr:ANTAR domain-containing protein [Blastococcus sp. VKM Ac-2987]MCZ2858333.1 ANTAR domain-containing protein [Blastococcus sp. VKM Ac-2987]